VRIAVVQLSDIHFQATSNVLISRVDRIVAAIRPILQQVQGVVFATTGDIAYSGDDGEYAVASNFFTALKEAVAEAEPGTPAPFVFIPGNHDCNFRLAGEVRSALIEGLSEKIETLDPTGEITRQVGSVHDNFFAFQARFRCEPEVPPQDRLRYQAKIRLGNVAITFDCYNTAWMSKKNEQEGTLLFPVRLLTTETDNEDGENDLRISLLHHRDNWLESNNARLLRDHLESHSDLILTGHEHHGDAYRKSKADGAGTQYVEGAVLQDPRSPGNSGFNVVEVDLKQGLRIQPFRWSGQRYSCEREGNWVPFEQNRARGRFQISPSFMRVLRDPGTGFLHPAKTDLALDDIFVYPDLVRRSLKKIVKSGVSSIPRVSPMYWRTR
jgi:predicted MPP superfamily phosphohydrolase